MIHRSLRLGWLALSVAALLSSACTRPEAPPPHVAALSVRPLDSAFVVGREAPLSVRAELSDGSSRLVSREAQWSSSDPERVSLRREGDTTVAVAAAPGAAELTASYEGVSAVLRVEVGPRVVDAVVVESVDGAVSLPKGRTFTLRAQATWSDGEIEDVTATAQWESAVPTQLPLTEVPGEVHAAAEGAGELRATFAGRTGALGLEVGPAVIDRFELDPPVASLAHGTSLQLLATAIYSDATAQDVTAETDWISLDEAVAGISAGLMEGRTPGLSRIEATFGDQRAELAVTVTPAELVGLSLSSTELSLPKGVSTTLKLTGAFTDGSAQDLTSQAQWSSSSAGVVASVADGKPGQFVGMDVGGAQLTASFGGMTATAEVTVTPAALQTLNVSPSTLEVPLGAPVSLVASGVYTDGSVVDLSAQVAWSSVDATTASVDAAGKVTPVQLGTTTLLAGYQGQMAAAIVNVTPATLVSVQLLGVPTTPLPKGSVVQLIASGTYSDGHTEDLTATAIWSTAHGTIAGASNATPTRGMVTGLAEGTTTVTASVGAVSSTASLTVGPPEVLSLELLLATTSLPKGTATGVRLNAVYTDATRVELTRDVTWSSSNPSVAFVDGNLNLYAAAEGTTALSTSWEAHSVSIQVEVTPPAVTAVTVPSADVSVAAGQSTQLSAFAFYSDGATVDVSQAAGWTSSDPSVATVTNQAAMSGLLTAHAPGVTWVEVSYEGETARFRVTVQ